jgi:hypothetical protein
MKAQLNRVLLEQTKWDSGSLTMLSSVVHRFPDEGMYTGTVYKKKEVVGHFHIHIDTKFSEKQINIDLRKLKFSPSKRIASLPNKLFNLNPDGNAVFFVSRGTGGFSVEIRKSGPKGGSASFDSKQLQQNDLYAITLVQPGGYGCTNARDKSECSIKVVPIKRGKQQFEPPKPVRVKVTQKGFTPSDISLLSTQTLVFQVMTPSRINIELSAVESGKKKKSKKPKVKRRI